MIKLYEKYIGAASHWVEAGWLTIALWGDTLEQHHTGLRQVGWQ